jgi:hypothetical protein
MLSVIKPRLNTLSVVKPIRARIFMLRVIIANVFMLNVVRSRVITINVTRTRVIILSDVWFGVINIFVIRTSVVYTKCNYNKDIYVNYRYAMCHIANYH